MTQLTSNLKTVALSFTLLTAPFAFANDATKELQQTQVASQGMSHKEWKHAHKEFKEKQKAEKKAFHAMKN